MKALRASVWIAEVVLAIFYAAAGAMKLTLPMDELAAVFPWTNGYSDDLISLTAFLDLLVAAGILIPDLLRSLPWATILAALLSVVLQVLAIVFHLWQGDFGFILFNSLVLAISSFVLWGWSKTHLPPAESGASI